MEKIPILCPFMPRSVIGKLKKTLFSGWIGEGPKVVLLERRLREYLGVKYVVCVNSGTSAVWLVCHLVGLKLGDKVISTPITCSATNIPFLHFGAKIIWADVEKETGNISPESIEKKLEENPDIKIICIVDYGGLPCRIDEIKKIAKKYKVKIIEDAAQALGAEYKNKKIGTHNEYVCFSLQAVKTITSVDGGFICLKSKKDFQRARKLRWFGIDRERKSKQKYKWRYNIKEAGYKMHMNDVLATIGVEQLKHLKNILKIQRSNAEYYSRNLKGLNDINLLDYNKNSKGSFWLYPLLVKNRKRFIDILDKNGIETTPIHQRNDKLDIFGSLNKSLINVDFFDKHSVCIPNGYWVDKKKRDYIVRTILKNFN